MAEKKKEAKNQVAKGIATVAKAGENREYRLKTLYREHVAPELQKKFGYKNIHQIPRLEKVVLNMGLGDVKDNAKAFQQAVEEMKQISGQKPVITQARKSVANFKIREGMNVGCKVTLRGARMYDFLDKLMNVVLPRVRDFKGVPTKSFDGRGSYAMGVKEQLIFPEITYEQVEKIRGMDICIVTTANTDEEAKELLSLLGMPFARN